MPSTKAHARAGLYFERHEHFGRLTRNSDEDGGGTESLAGRGSPSGSAAPEGAALMSRTTKTKRRDAHGARSVLMADAHELNVAALEPAFNLGHYLARGRRDGDVHSVEVAAPDQRV